MNSNIGWVEVFIILIALYIFFPCWIYVVFKMATMGIFEGLLHTLNNIKKGEVENGKRQEI